MSTNTMTAALAGAAAGALAYAAYSKYSKGGNDKIIEKAIMDRRSMFLQDLNGEAAPDEAIERMLEVANWAPTHGQTQAWRFAVFRRETGEIEKFYKLQMTASEEKLKDDGVPLEEQKALKKFIEKTPKKAKDIAKCSHVIAICMKRQTNPEKLMPEWEELCSIAAAVQNAHILACELGVATYWTSGGIEGPLNTKEVRDLLKLDDGDKCLGFLMVGKANPETWAKNREKATRGIMSEKTAWF